MRRSTVLLGLVLGFAAAAPRLAAQAAPDGKALYDKNCKTCHGLQGVPPAALAKKLKVPTIDAAYLAKVSDDSMVKFMTNGSKNMKPMKEKATEPELAAIAKHVRSMVGAPAAKPPAAQGADGKAAYDKNCKSCHGVKGTPPAALAKQLKMVKWDSAYIAARSDDSLVKVMKHGGKNMKGFDGKMTPAEMEAVAKYVRQLVSAKPGT